MSQKTVKQWKGMMFFALLILILATLVQTERILSEKPPAEESDPNIFYSKASWYDYTLPSGWSSYGEYVCAARDFPRRSLLKITHRNRSVVCEVTDYGPNPKIHPDRLVDLSSTAFRKLAPLSVGVIKVKIESVESWTP